MSTWENRELLSSSSRGFVYLIINTVTNKLYVGKKKLISETRVPVEGRKNKRIVRKPSNWETYYGSCKPLTADIKRLGKDKFRRIILGAFDELHSNNYAEADLQFLLGVLSDGKVTGFKFYNRNIKITTMRYVANRDYVERVHKILEGLKI